MHAAFFPPVLASLRAALDQPVFPGKVVVWLLFMLSIVSWVMILSKLLQLRKSQRADQRFTDRLRKSKTALEVYEQDGQEDDASPKHLVYQAGARETAYWLLGSRERRTEPARDRPGAKLTEHRTGQVRAAFEAGFRRASGRLGAGVEGLRPIGGAALLLGAFGFVWTLMEGFDGAAEFAELAPKVGGALGHLAISILVAGPAILARTLLLAAIRVRTERLARFRDDMVRLFERSFSATLDAPSIDRAPRSEPPKEGEGGESPGGEGRKRYHSVRDRLLRGEADEPEGAELQMNPIARQATEAGGSLRGY